MLTPFETEALLLSLKVGGIATLGVLIPAILISHLLARGRFPLKWLLDGIVHAPLVVPPVVLVVPLRPAALVVIEVGQGHARQAPLELLLNLLHSGFFILGHQRKGVAGRVGAGGAAGTGDTTA